MASSLECAIEEGGIQASRHPGHLNHRRKARAPLRQQRPHVRDTLVAEQSHAHAPAIARSADEGDEAFIDEIGRPRARGGLGESQSPRQSHRSQVRTDLFVLRAGQGRENPVRHTGSGKERPSKTSRHETGRICADRPAKSARIRMTPKEAGYNARTSEASISTETALRMR